MAYHHHEDKNKMLTCPDCGSVQVYPIDEYPGYTPRGVDLEDSLYEGITYLNNYSLKEDYEYKNGHKPLKRQNHFVCGPCMEEWPNLDYEADYSPIYRYVDLGTVPVSKVKNMVSTKDYNPYVNYFKNRKALKASDDTDVLAGLCVKAEDTGKVLLLKRRSHSELPVNNPGVWEFPGGHVKKNETPFEAAKREWEEEVGRKLPHGRFEGMFQEHQYHGYIYVIPEEKAVNLSDKGRGPDPDDPDGKHPQMLKWWKIKKIKKGIKKHKVRHRLHEVQWRKIKKASAEKAWYQ
jgi:8-oxo-dGTP pyrophosphatase MutT (NUDIX family)